MTPPIAMILASGQSHRVGGGEKALLSYGNETLLSTVIGRVAPQVETLALNANGDIARFSGHRLPVIKDVMPGQIGPLVGILTAMEWASDRGAEAVFTVPTDMPYLPPDLIPRLILASEQDPMKPAIAASGETLHPLVGRWPVDLRAPLRMAIKGGMQKITDWIEVTGSVIALFPLTSPDAFTTLDTPEQFSKFDPNKAQ